MLCDLNYTEKLPFDGTSLTEALRNSKANVTERTLVVHDKGRFGKPVGEGPLIKYKDFAVKNGRWRLVGDELFDLSSDPSQKKNIEAEHPEMVAKLKKEFESWWAGISEKSNEYNPFIVNPEKQKVVKISSQNLLGDDVAYSQRMVRGAMPSNGWAVIEVEAPGKYLISLSRFSKEANLKINDVAPAYPMHPSTHNMRKPNDRALNVVSARLEIGSFDKTVGVNGDEKEIVFEVELPKGEQSIQLGLRHNKRSKMLLVNLYRTCTVEFKRCT